MLERVKLAYLKRQYQIDDWSDVEEFLTKLAKRAGRLLKGGEPDIQTVAKMVLNDFQRGKLPYFVPPPGSVLDGEKVKVVNISSIFKYVDSMLTFWHKFWIS